jgi:hypothetical protein
MRHAVAIFTIFVLATTAPAQGKSKDRAPRFADYPVAKLEHMRVAKPKVPNLNEDPLLRLRDTVRDDSRANFAGRYFMAVWGCGTACVVGAILEAKTGRVNVWLPTVSSWLEVHDKFEGIDFRHDSRLLVLSGQRAEKKGDMGRHFYVFDNGRLKFLRTIRTNGNFTEENR